MGHDGCITPKKQRTYVYCGSQDPEMCLVLNRTVAPNRLRKMSAAMTLTELSEQRLSEGSLPHWRKCRTYGGRSIGRACALCEKWIPQDAYEVEIIFCR